jgi:hypothetical protein
MTNNIFENFAFSSCYFSGSLLLSLLLLLSLSAVNRASTLDTVSISSVLNNGLWKFIFVLPFVDLIKTKERDELSIPLRKR